MLAGRATAPGTTRPTRPAKLVGWADVPAFVLRSDVARTGGDGENSASYRIPVQLRKMLDARPVAATDGAHGPGGRRGQRSAHAEGVKVDFWPVGRWDDAMCAPRDLRGTESCVGPLRAGLAGGGAPKAGDGHRLRSSHESRIRSGCL